MAAMLGATSVTSLVRGVSSGAALSSSFTGDKVRVSAGVACAVPCKSVQIVAEALRDGVGASAPWDAQRASAESALASLSTEISAVATEFAPTSLFGLTEGLESDEEYEDSEEGEIIRVDNESVDDEDELAVANLGIPLAVVEALAKRGIEKLFPIQRAVLDPAMQGRDLIGRAKTGTGKTLAFGIPIIHNIIKSFEADRTLRRSGRSPRALVLAPTRELAKQVEREFMESAPMLSTICVYGGVSITTQQRQLQRGVDIAVGTPGRIIDLIDRRSLSLKDVTYMVLDEADQMLAVGFEEDVERILEQMPGERQSMLFSATMPSWVKKLSKKYLKNPLTIDLVGDSNEKLAEGIKMLAVSIPPSAKRTVLSDLITVYGSVGKTIVFTQTKRDADDVASVLGRTLGCEALHGDITQSQRERTLAAFREGRFSVLVATDVAARGLDIPNVDLVVHYEIPNDPETFVHRSGRTGRAGKDGTAILMYSENQRRTMRNIEVDVGCKFERIGAPQMEEVLHASSSAAKAVIQRVHPEVSKVFLSTAESLLEKEGPAAFAAALAHLSGFSQLPAPRSLITHEEGLMTLRMIRTEELPRAVSARMVMGVLADIWQVAADNVGKIRIIDDPKVQGAVFDLPAEIAKELLTKPRREEDVIESIKKVPKLVDPEAERGRGSDMYGRFGSRGGSGGMRSSSSRGGRGGSFRGRDSGWGSDRSGGDYGRERSGRRER
ncbi:hypothetical protein M758_5G046000 [Ceratodon purpureus]|nr:hypothetical protein M758_5G046000 [Ceratodon purpureus]